MPKKEDGILRFIIFSTRLSLDFITKVLSLTSFAFFKGDCWRKSKPNPQTLLPCSANDGTSAWCYSITDLRRKQLRRSITPLQCTYKQNSKTLLD